MYQLEGRINSQILGVKRLSACSKFWLRVGRYIPMYIFEQSCNATTCWLNMLLDTNEVCLLGYSLSSQLLWHKVNCRVTTSSGYIAFLWVSLIQGCRLSHALTLWWQGALLVSQQIPMILASAWSWMTQSRVQSTNHWSRGSFMVLRSDKESNKCSLPFPDIFFILWQTSTMKLSLNPPLSPSPLGPS